ncbi:MAG: hypothetical protein ACI8TQ_002594, partial [Planctomycetota bacterium]
MKPMHPDLPSWRSSAAKSLCLLPILITGAFSLNAEAGTFPFSASAVAIPQSESQATASPNPNARKRTRLLHLTSGSILRGSSRLEGDEWKVLVAQNWTTIPVSMVERAV